MKYAVDKIENEVATLENIMDGSKINILVNDIPFNIRESDILVFNGENYIKDDSAKNKRLKEIRDKMSKLKNKNKWIYWL